MMMTVRRRFHATSPGYRAVPPSARDAFTIILRISSPSESVVVQTGPLGGTHRCPEGTGASLVANHLPEELLARRIQPVRDPFMESIFDRIEAAV
jgi:hypothetical protein